MSVRLWAKMWLERMRLPPVAKEVLRNDRSGRLVAVPDAHRAIEEGIAWIGHAQDCSTSNDGGVARHFSLLNGWSPSYPETTGYIIATLLDYARNDVGDELVKRVRRMLDWLVSIQFENGGFQGGIIGQTPRVPVTFNTGQVLIGLSAGASLDDRYRDAMKKAADWLVATLDEDGCWRRYPTPFATPGAKAYETHVALALFRAASLEPEARYAEAAFRQVDWALTNQAENGWLDHCCLTDRTQPLTHTLGYALRGIIEAFLYSKRECYLQAACRTADGLMTALRPDGWLPGRLDSNWRATVDWVCLTGSSQIAESWLLLHRATGRPDYRTAALRANAFVRRTMSVDGPPDIRGAVKGSYPVDGWYGRWQYLSWACKFTLDANRAELALG